MIFGHLQKEERSRTDVGRFPSLDLLQQFKTKHHSTVQPSLARKLFSMSSWIDASHERQLLEEKLHER